MKSDVVFWVLNSLKFIRFIKNLRKDSFKKVMGMWGRL